MKRTATTFCVMALAFAVAQPLPAQEEAAAGSRVAVTLDDVSRMREVKHLRGAQQRDTTQAIQSLAGWLQHQAERRLPAEQSLQITLRDVDLAGEYEPGRMSDMHDIRIIKTLYPPRIELEYRLSDASGTVLREGEATLRDTGFLLGAGPLGSDPLRYEKRMLRDWLRSITMQEERQD